jgi:hypothetical protein
VGAAKGVAAIAVVAADAMDGGTGAAIGVGAGATGAGAGVGGATAPGEGGATPIMVAFMRGFAPGPAAFGAGAPLGVPAAGEPGRGTMGGALTINMVPLNFGAAAPFRLKPHFWHAVALSSFCVPQFGQNTLRTSGGARQARLGHGGAYTCFARNLKPAGNIIRSIALKSLGCDWPVGFFIPRVRLRLFRSIGHNFASELQAVT